MFDSIRALHRQKTEDKIRNGRPHDLSKWTMLSLILTAATLIVGLMESGRIKNVTQPGKYR